MPAILAGLFLSVSNTEAAEVYLAEADGLPVIRVQGPLESGDEARFADVSRQSAVALVELNGPGGDLAAGLAIGRQIARRGFTTSVAMEGTCASACALAWLAGQVRLMDATSRVGFHAASVDLGRGLVVVGSGNALIGSYLHALGYSDRAIAYVTEASPEGMSWLDPDAMDHHDIKVAVVHTEAPEPVEMAAAINATAAPTAYRDLNLPSGNSWIVLKAGPTISTVDHGAAEVVFGPDQVMVVESVNGLHALVAGPVRTGDGRIEIARLKEARAIPADTYLAKGGRFVGIVKN